MTCGRIKGVSLGQFAIDDDRFDRLGAHRSVPPGTGRAAVPPARDRPKYQELPRIRTAPRGGSRGESGACTLTTGHRRPCSAAGAATQGAGRAANLASDWRAMREAPKSPADPAGLPTPTLPASGGAHTAATPNPLSARPRSMGRSSASSNASATRSRARCAAATWSPGAATSPRSSSS
jgi:hypothetical protein